MSVHEQMESLADLLIAGGLSAEEKVEVERHAAGCPACATLVRDAREFAAWTKGVIKPDAPPVDLEDRVIKRFRAAGQTKKRRFIVGKRVLRVTGSIAAAVALIFLGNMATVKQSASGGEFHVHFTLDHDAHDHPGDPADIPAKLRSLSSAEADFRANDRDWNHVNDFWDGNIKGLNSTTPEAIKTPNEKGKEGESLRTYHWGLGLQKDRSKLELYDVDDLTYGMASMDGVNTRRRLAERGGESQLGRKAKMGGDGEPLDEARSGKSTDLPATSAGISGVFSKNLKDTTTVLVVDPTPVPVQDNRKIIRNGDVSVEVDSYDATYTKLAELAAAEKGFIASANTQKLANGKIQATVVVRIPPDRFEAVIARFKELGTIRHQNIGSEDVTKAYVDLESRLAGKQILATRLSKLLAEGKGTVKELMEVEVQLGATNEAIESIKGEIKYYDNRIGLSTITLQIAEKDLGQPFEYVQTLSANLALTVRDPDEAYAKAQKEIVDAGGQVVDSKMNRQNDGSSTGTIRGRVDADKFQALRDALKKLGVATNDTVNQQKTAHGGGEGTPKVDAPLRKEQAILDLSVSSPPIFVTKRSQLLVETSEVESAYTNSRKAVEGAGGKIVDGSLSGRADRMAAVLRIQIDADKFTALVESLKTAGKVKNAVVNSVLPATAADGGAALLRERAEIELNLVSPPQLIADENGIVKTVRDTFANSWAGLLWSVEKLFVGISLAGPWLILLALGIFFWRRRRKKSASVAP